MKFFEHFFQTDEIKKQELTKIFHEIDKSSWIQVFSACLGKMMVIQNNASECIVKGRGWNVDFSSRSLFFGEDEYKFQYIGSESTVSNTWMWGWENINLSPEESLVLANEMKSKGCDWNLDSLATPQFELTDLINGHTLSIVSCGLSEENYFYYRGPHNNGAVYLAVEYAEKDYLPRWFTDYVFECFTAKTMLKGGDPVAYALAKAKVNSSGNSFNCSSSVILIQFDELMSISK